MPNTPVPAGLYAGWLSTVTRQSSSSGTHGCVQATADPDAGAKRPPSAGPGRAAIAALPPGARDGSSSTAAANSPGESITASSSRSLIPAGGSVAGPGSFGIATFGP